MTRPAARRVISGLLLLVFTFGRMVSAEADVTNTTEVNQTMKPEKGGLPAGGGARNGGLAQSPVKIAAFESPSFFTRNISPSGDVFNGYLADLVREMSQTVSFHFEWVLVNGESHSNANRQKNGNSWEELTDILTSAKANVIVLPLNLANLQNAERFSYTRPFLRSTMSLLHKAPSSLSEPQPLLLENLLNDTDRSRFGIGVTSEMVAHLLKATNSTLYHRLWKDRSPSEIILSLEAGLRKVREGDFALILESTEAAYLASKEPCDLQAQDQFTHETSYVFATKMNSSLTSMLDGILSQLGATDFFGELYRKWWDTDDCTLRREGKGKADYEDHDLDMERIFFTSPIKFYKSSAKPFSQEGSHHLPTSTTVIWNESNDPCEHLEYPDNKREDLGDDGQGPSVFGAECSTQVTRAIRESNRKRGRTTSSAATTARQPILHATQQGNDIRFRTDSGIQGKSQRTSHTRISVSKETTPNPLARHFGSDIKRVDIGHVTHYSVSSTRTIPGSSEQGMGETDNAHSGQRANDGPGYNRDNSQDDALSRTTTRNRVRTTKPNKDFAMDIDWFFVTHEPRISDEVNYDPEQELSENTEQRAAVQDLDSDAKVKVDVSSTQKSYISSSNIIEIPFTQLVLTALTLLSASFLSNHGDIVS